MSIFIVDNMFHLFRTRCGTVAEFDPNDYHLAVNYCESRFCGGLKLAQAEILHFRHINYAPLQWRYLDKQSMQHLDAYDAMYCHYHHVDTEIDRCTYTRKSWLIIVISLLRPLSIVHS